MNPVAITSATSGAGAAGVSVLVWVLSLWHITIPADVAASLVLLVAVIAHGIVALFNRDQPAMAQVQVPVAAPPAVQMEQTPPTPTQGPKV